MISRYNASSSPVDANDDAFIDGLDVIGSVFTQANDNAADRRAIAFELHRCNSIKNAVIDDDSISYGADVPLGNVYK